jgi:hypothetical protein
MQLVNEHGEAVAPRPPGENEIRGPASSLNAGASQKRRSGHSGTLGFAQADKPAIVKLFKAASSDDGAM